MNMPRRHVLAALTAVALLTTPALAQETIRVGLPTKTYWPTTVVGRRCLGRGICYFMYTECATFGGFKLKGWV